MNRKLSSIATLFAAGAFAATTATPAPLASTTRHGSDTSYVEAGCGGDKAKEGEKGKDASCGKDKDGSCGKDKKMKDGSCGKDKKAAKGAKTKKGAKDGSCGKDKKAGKEGEKGCGAACGSKKKDGGDK